jgi:hypothetical protein
MDNISFEHYTTFLRGLCNYRGVGQMKSVSNLCDHKFNLIPFCSRIQLARRNAPPTLPSVEFSLILPASVFWEGKNFCFQLIISETRYFWSVMKSYLGWQNIHFCWKMLFESIPKRLTVQRKFWINPRKAPKYKKNILHVLLDDENAISSEKKAP